MNKPKILLATLFLASLTLGAQDIACDDNRYLNQVFTELDSVQDVQYGLASTLAGRSQKLLLDIYLPKENLEGVRPLIIMAHGGSFVGGNRAQTAEACRNFARRGYVVANIEYRLIDALVVDSIGIFEGVIMAINDMRAAVRYFKEDAANENTYKISGSSIFVAGVSAGAIMANHLGFLDPMDEVPEYLQAIMDKHGGFEGNSSNNTMYSSDIQGVLNYSGGLLRSSWIDGDDPPVYSAHDDQDPVVPCTYNTSNTLPFPITFYGSCDIKSAADQMNISNQLYLVANSTEHVSYYYDESSRTQVFQESAAFLKSIICNATGRDAEEFTAEGSGISVYPNPFVNVLNIKTDAEIQAISVSNLLGQSYLETGKFQGNQLDLGKLPAGVYMIRLKTNQGVSVIKAVKQ